MNENKMEKALKKRTKRTNNKYCRPQLRKMGYKTRYAMELLEQILRELKKIRIGILEERLEMERMARVKAATTELREIIEKIIEEQNQTEEGKRMDYLDKYEQWLLENGYEPDYEKTTKAQRKKDLEELLLTMGPPRNEQEPTKNEDK